MHAVHEHGDGLLSRAELEIELARFALATERKRGAIAGRPRGADPFVSWFEDAAVDLINRVAPELRPVAIERIQHIAEFNGQLEITQLDVDASTLKFAPDPDPQAAPG